MHEHAGAEPAACVRKRRLHSYVASRLIHHGVDGADSAVEHDVAEIAGGNANAAPQKCLMGLLLRNAEVDVDRVQRLQRHHRIATGHVLTEVDLPDAEHS